MSALDRQRKFVTTAGGDQLAYAALVLALAAGPVPALEHTLTGTGSVASSRCVCHRRRLERRH